MTIFKVHDYKGKFLREFESEETVNIQPGDEVYISEFDATGEETGEDDFRTVCNGKLWHVSRHDVTLEIRLYLLTN